VPSFELPDLTLSYIDRGHGERCILLVHGWTCDIQDWRFQEDVFASRARLVAVDLRGHGKSTCPTSGYRPFDFAADIAALLDHLELSHVVAVGHSLGALIISALAIDRPDLVDACVVVDPPYGAIEPRVGFLAGILDGLRRDSSGLDALLEAFTAMAGPNASEDIKELHRSRVLAMEPFVVAETLAGVHWGPDQFGQRPETEAYLAKRTCPVLAVYADPARARWEESIATHPQSRVLTFEGAGHWLHQVEPDRFNAEVLAWLDDVVPSH
jgi:pimeloyl-ACP methyl ester carboxylesterase